jgi:hypothetical protein
VQPVGQQPAPPAVEGVGHLVCPALQLRVVAQVAL